MLANVSSLVPVKWYLGNSPRSSTLVYDLRIYPSGIPFNDTNFRFQIAELAEEKLEGHLLGLQAGNEPDLYGV